MKLVLREEYEQIMELAKGRYHLDFWQDNPSGKESYLKLLPEPFDIISWYRDMGHLQNVEQLSQEALIKFQPVHYSMIQWEAVKE